MVSDKTARLSALFFLGLLLFNFPIVRLFSVPKSVAGIPVLFWYLVIAWLAILIGTARLADRRREE